MVRWQAPLDWLVASAKTAGRTQNVTLRILLHLGLYQLFWLQRIPDHAAVHETVELAKRLGLRPTCGISQCHSLLRLYTRAGPDPRAALADLKRLDPIRRSVIRIRPGLVECWQNRWGAREKLFACSNGIIALRQFSRG